VVLGFYVSSRLGYGSGSSVREGVQGREGPGVLAVGRVSGEKCDNGEGDAKGEIVDYPNEKRLSVLGYGGLCCWEQFSRAKQECV
jgi:hypothetical protein